MASGDTLFILEAANSAALSNGTSVDQAILVTRNGFLALAFPSGSTQDAAAEWTVVMPEEYDGGGLTVTLYWTGATGTSANQVHFELAFEDCTGSSIDSVSYAAAATTDLDTAYQPSPVTAGVPDQAVFTVSNGADMDSVTAGSIFRVRLLRDPDDSSDNYAGDAQVHKLVFKET